MGEMDPVAGGEQGARGERQGRRDCERRELGLGLGFDATLYTNETR
jgi:hypothetical protein